MEDKTITIEDLARMINEGFKSTATKEDITALEDRLATRLDHLDARVGRIEADIHELRDEAVRRHEFEDALARITYLEKKLGIEAGCNARRLAQESRHALAAFLYLPTFGAFVRRSPALSLSHLRHLSRHLR
jgi:hypothetical protein